MKRVLVVDDSPMVRKLIKKTLLPPDYEVVGEASNGEEAAKLYDQFLPDFVTMDVTMPIMDGLEASKKILQKNPKAKILLLSAMGDEDLVAQARSIGIKGNAKKPFKPDELLQAVQNLLKG